MHYHAINLSISEKYSKREFAVKTYRVFLTETYRVGLVFVDWVWLA